MGEMHAEPAEAPAPPGPVARNGSWFDALYPHLHRVACVAAPADVDLVQDALVSLLSLADPDSVRDRRAYLTTSIVHLAANRRRSWSRRRAAVARLQTPVGSHDELPSDLADLLALPPRERAVLYLHHVQGHPYDEVGRLVGCTAAAARKAAERGRSRLADALGEETDR